MHDIPNRIADVLLQVEATLRVHGRWDPQRPPAGALDSDEPFCVDTLRFEQWLQRHQLRYQPAHSPSQTDKLTWADALFFRVSSEATSTRRHNQVSLIRPQLKK